MCVAYMNFYAPHAYRCSERPEEGGYWSPWRWDIDVCEPSDMGAGSQIRSCARTVNTLNH